MGTLQSPSPVFDADKLTSEIFSILENKFLFGYDDRKIVSNCNLDSTMSMSGNRGKVRILSIDGGDGILAGKCLAHLEACLHRESGNTNAHIADYFDVVAGSGDGGLLAGLLFTPGKDGRPIFTADEALNFLLEKKVERKSSTPGFLRRFSRKTSKTDKENVFGEFTLKDTLKSILIPCYDLSTKAPFLFSRADAVEMDGYDFKIKDVCLATSADPTVAKGAIEIMSVDKTTKILAVHGGVAGMNNPTAAAITHVLNNKHEFPFCNAVEDLLVVSLGNGESSFEDDGDRTCLSPADFVRIAGEGSSDMVDQSVSMAFGEYRRTNYVRIQANNNISKLSKTNLSKLRNKKKNRETIMEEQMKITEEMLKQRNLEAVLFQGKKLAENTNSEKLDLLAGEIVKEQERRQKSVLPTVVLKQATTSSSRTSSATTLSSLSS